jgi:NADH-quinone oxidoreductase subunit H
MPRFLEAIEDVVGATIFYFAVSPLLKIAAALVVVLTTIAYLTLAERKILGFIQARVGPNRVGPWGLFQPIADVAKLLVKEDIVPQRAIKWAFVLGPCLVVGPATSTWRCCLCWRWRRSVSTVSFWEGGARTTNFPYSAVCARRRR